MTQMAEKIVVFGAGATGRGHVGLLAWQAGFEIVFVDKKPELVDALQRAGPLHGQALRRAARRRSSSPATGSITHAERAAIAEEIRDAALVLTAVFDQNLPDVAETHRPGHRGVRRAGRTAPLNCIACENMMDSSTHAGASTSAACWPATTWPGASSTPVFPTA